MLDVVPLRYGTAFKKAFSDPLAFHALVKAAVGIEFMPERVEQEFTYREPFARVNVAYDLYAEDTARRAIVELQHIREDTSYDRFLYYHCIGLAEQIALGAARLEQQMSLSPGLRAAGGRGLGSPEAAWRPGRGRIATAPEEPRPIATSERYRFERDVYTLVVFTRWPEEPAMRYGRAVCDLDPVTDEGRRLGVYRHRLVFINARAPLDRVPPELRPLVGLIEDTLDGQVDEARYPDEVSQHILSRIRRERLTPEENARVKEEGTWEDVKRDERQLGRAEALRTAIADLCEAYGLSLTAAQEAELAALDLAGLEALRLHLKAHRCWPG